MKKIYALLMMLTALGADSYAQTYCVPVFTVGCSSGDYIDLCTTTGGTTNISNSFSGCNGQPNNYIDMSATQILTIAPGNTFNFTLQSGPSWPQGFGIWIDYNDNGSFYDPGEAAWNSGFASTSAFTGSITVPLTASGVSIMRVICVYAGVPFDPCGTATFGETEDYGAVFCTIPPTPTVTSPVSTCVGASATLNASVASGTLNWYDVATGGLSQGTGTSFTTPTYTQAGPDTFWVASENGGCSSSRVPIYVNVAAQTTVNLGSDTSVCGTSHTLDAGYPGSLYLWSTGAGTQTINVTTSGTYSVTLITPIGCTGQDVITVTLIAPPGYTLGNDTGTCGNQVVVDAGSGYTTYAWSTGGSAQMETVTSNDTVGVTVIDANGCVLTDTIIVTLNPSPIVNLGPDVVQCGGSATIDAGNPGAIYFWSNSTSSQTTNVTTTGTYYVDVLTQAGCAGSDTIDVTINYQPVVDLGPDTAICGNNIQLDAGNPGNTYAWSTTATTQIVSVVSGTYSVTVTSPAGCVDGDTIVVTTNATPPVTCTQDTSICPGGTATLNAYGALTYLWSNNQTTQSIAVQPSTNTSYYVTGTDVNGCQASAVTIVTIMPTANAQFIVSGISGATASFQNQSSGAISYSWNFGDASPANNTASPSHTYTANGTYTVTLTVTGPCGTDMYTQTVTITQVGIQDNDLANTLSIYPNPNSGHFTVSFECNEAKDVVIELTDLSGRVITSIRKDNVTVFNQQLGDENLADGIYFVNITTTEGVVTRKIVVQK